ncbi:hypothetical protein LJC55_03075, partial [Eubacteriales bacterium OttesenSCG-928-N14]|nr:hypothetical protein [Eubacteriales bacterium OttesenSCG-928-N14]
MSDIKKKHTERDIKTAGKGYRSIKRSGKEVLHTRQRVNRSYSENDAESIDAYATTHVSRMNANAIREGHSQAKSIKSMVQNRKKPKANQTIEIADEEQAVKSRRTKRRRTNIVGAKQKGDHVGVRTSVTRKAIRRSSAKAQAKKVVAQGRG